LAATLELGSGSVCFGYHAEEIAARILEYNEICVRPISPRIPFCAETQQTLDLAFLIIGVKIKMDPASSSGSPVARLE
jgi:hypothetical protein